MNTITLAPKKRKNIDLPSDVWKKLSIMAAAQGKSLKAFAESVLMAKADVLELEVVPPEKSIKSEPRPYPNPSPSGDLYFADAENRKEIEERVKSYWQGKPKETIVLRSADDIAEFIENL